MAYQFFPDLSDDEFAGLKKSIAENGMGYPVIEDENGNILDGHHRVRAWNELVREGKAAGKFLTVVREGLTEADKISLVLSLNFDRRHLTSAQKREIIAMVLAADHERSDRQISSEVGVDHKTVGAVRKDAEQRGEIPHVDKTTDTLGREQPRKESSNVPRQPALNRLRTEARKVTIAEGHSPSNFGTIAGTDSASAYCRLCGKESKVFVGSDLTGPLFEKCKGPINNSTKLPPRELDITGRIFSLAPGEAVVFRHSEEYCTSNKMCRPAIDSSHANEKAKRKKTGLRYLAIHKMFENQEVVVVTCYDESTIFNQVITVGGTNVSPKNSSP